ncbi:phage head closure protein [Eubacterium ventriosum]|uniref:phage head closure protein n=1 Tax=Eubacterium ventriosum TaxID=39496 RepID=UPI00265DA427|nr:phage head closure protein [Eubacterium ventriosum]
MNRFKANLPFNVPAILFVPTEKRVKGVLTKEYKEKANIFVSFKTFGGTESNSNGQLVIENTATVQTWWNDEIKANCRLKINGVDYEIIGTPENINMMNQFLQFKVKAVKGGA